MQSSFVCSKLSSQKFIDNVLTFRYKVIRIVPNSEADVNYLHSLRLQYDEVCNIFLTTS